MPKASIIVTTYNWPEALDRTLSALTQQTFDDFEVIVADDGSTDPTRELITTYQRNTTLTIQHVWHPDKGFRAAAIRNRTIEQAAGDYIVFLDGDCIPRPHFLSRHIELAEPGHFITGNRILLSEAFTTEVLHKKLSIENLSLWRWLSLRLTGQSNRFLPLIKIPGTRWRHYHPTKWEGAITCNLAAWKSDLIDINGFDESFTGWGLEDSDLVIRLINSDVLRKEGRYSTAVFHLWHPQVDQSALETNKKHLEHSINNHITHIFNGINKKQGSF